MKAFTKRRLVIASVVYWFLLIYIIAALVWWFITLESQNRQMANYRLSELKMDDPTYLGQYESITEEKKRKTGQYIGEGITFLALTLVAALFVYRAARRQFLLQHQQENFMMAITHELKTPIAIAKLNLETLQKHSLDEAKRQKLLLTTIQETNRLNTLANNILVSSQLEGLRHLVAKEELNFSELVKSTVQDFKTRFPETNWKTAIEPEMDITGDALLLQILVNNLLENAIKYSPKESTIQCVLNHKNRAIVLQVLDHGPGIPESEKKKVFDKFYRIGNEATRTTKGTGLGLYLCKKIAIDHRATIKVTDNSPSGCIFTVSFTV
jgi:two-component system, OmpR family, sensor histidine kinase CiaH